MHGFPSQNGLIHIVYHCLAFDFDKTSKLLVIYMDCQLIFAVYTFVCNNNGDVTGHPLVAKPQIIHIADMLNLITVFYYQLGLVSFTKICYMLGNRLSNRF